jgi:hypothetical protein
MLKRFKHDKAAMNLLEDVYKCNAKREALRQEPIPSDFTRIRLQKQKKRPKKKKPVTGSALFAQKLMNLPSAISESWQAVAVLLWVVVGLGFYTQVEDWTVVQTLYWQVATVTTVGYGDFAPKTDLGKVVTIFYAIFGLVVVFSTISDAFAAMKEKIEAAVMAKDDDEEDEEEDASPTIMHEVLKSIVTVIVVVMVGAVFFALNEKDTDDFKDLPWLKAFYWCFVTTTTGRSHLSNCCASLADSVLLACLHPATAVF